MKRLTIDKARKLAEDNGGKFLSKEYTNSKTKYKWQCEFGHIWMATASSVKQGHWCPYCAGNMKLTVCDCAREAESRGGKFLSDKYVDSNTKYKWQCDLGHSWMSRMNDVKQGHWCPECANVGKMLDIEVCKKLAVTMGGKFLSNKYTGSRKKYKWCCGSGHIWEARVDSVQSGVWCQECKKPKIEVFIDFALSMGGLFLSDKYINNRTKYKWQCKCGHIWSATSHSVINGGTWCPRCARSKGEEGVNSILRKCLGETVIHSRYRGLDWLVNKETGYKLELDFFIPELNIAVEYHGRQHFEPVCFGGITECEAKKELKQINRRDLIKKRLVKKHNLHFIEIPYDMENIEEFLTKEIENIVPMEKIK